MSHKSEIQETYTARGLVRYQLEIWHHDLNKYQVIKDSDIFLLEQKAQTKMDQWDAMWEKKQNTEMKRLEREEKAQAIEEKKVIAQERTIESQNMLDLMENILNHTLDIDDAIDWETLKNTQKFPKPKPIKIPPPPKPPPPIIYPPPNPNDKKYKPEFGLFDKLSKTKQESIKNQATASLRNDQRLWEEYRTKHINHHNETQKNYELKIKKFEKNYLSAVKKWRYEKETYLNKQNEQNKIVDIKKEKYLNCDQESILDYCDMVLSNSEYPDDFPQDYELDYNPENKLLIVDYQLPPLEAIPTTKELKYVQTQNKFSEKHITKSQHNSLYDNVLNQITLRTIHELYEADKVNGLVSIIFNGYVKSTDPSTGQETNSCVLSIQANKEEFLQINLARIEPKACFKKLKGVGSSKLHSMTPIAPILRIERGDKRFTDSYAVAENLDEGYNLAAMDWEDFEHLIRELFEQAFAESGGEVKVTRASKDGGVDAVIFDPDPLKGGKIIVQAKRYTNVVGVSAVRDLYGTLMNEGAMKGILVTTADFGPDAYEFVKGKPLQLLNGSNLLHLLEKHGHKARIDLKEAKQILLEKESNE